MVEAQALALQRVLEYLGDRIERISYRDPYGPPKSVDVVVKLSATDKSDLRKVIYITPEGRLFYHGRMEIFLDDASFLKSLED